MHLIVFTEQRTQQEWIYTSDAAVICTVKCPLHLDTKMSISGVANASVGLRDAFTIVINDLYGN